jgi:hypothetical protein
MVRREHFGTSFNASVNDVALAENFSSTFLKFMLFAKASNYTPQALLDFDRFILRCEYNGRSCMNVTK